VWWIVSWLLALLAFLGACATLAAGLTGHMLVAAITGVITLASGTAMLAGEA
jgi:uncharacterized membrane protein YuzA (DUF378 family)